MAKISMYRKVAQAFYARFGSPPQLIVRSPGRVNLLGGHTDYNDGLVMPVAVDRAVWLAVSPVDAPEAMLHAVDMGGAESTFAVDRVPAAVGGWSDYPMAVLWAFLERGLQPVGINALFSSTVPVGAGMSSSAALELAFAYAWDHLSGFGLTRETLAQLCQQAENEYVGVNCGIMDQMIAACGKAGHAMLLDTRTLEYHHFPVPAQAAIVVADSQVRRTLAHSEYNARRVECEQAVRLLREYLPDIASLRDVRPQDLEQYGAYLPEKILQRARHVVTENVRVVRMAQALHAGNLKLAGQLISAGHRSLRDDYEVSIPELDTLVAAAQEVPGCYGARLTGAGFGGCMVALVHKDAVAALAAHLKEVYQAHFDLTPDVYVTHPADGVSVAAQAVS